MSRGLRIGLATVVLLGCAAAALSVRIAHHFERGGALRAEVGRTRLTRLAPETVERLETLQDDVLVTYYVSPRHRMPSSMRHVERRVTDLLEALRARSDGRFDFQIVDPETQPDLKSFAKRRRIAPFRLRSVTRDAYDERTVWSALAISYGAYPEAHVHAVGPEHLPRLQATLVAWLDQLERPREPRIALAAPQGFGELAETLADRGELVPARPEAGEPLPEADLLVWMRPREVDESTLRELDRFLDAGGSVLVAGGRLQLDERSLVDSGGEPAVRIFPAAGGGARALATLLPHFGLHPRPGLYLDERADSFEPPGAAGERVTAPFLVRCIAPNQDFHTFRGQPNGTLLFTAPTPLRLDDAVLRRGGWAAEVLATTSDATWVQDEPGPGAPPIRIADMAPENGEWVAKQPLIVSLRPRDPWRGRVIAVGATTPFEDGLLRREGAAHRRLLSVILDECTSDERLVVAGAEPDRPAAIPPTGALARTAWRSFCVFLVPGLLLVFGVRRLLPARRTVPSTSKEARVPGSWRVPASAFGLLLLAVLLTRASAGLGARVDATSDGRNRLSNEARAVAARVGEGGAVTAELVFSDRAELPPPQRERVRDLQRLLRDFERAGCELDVRRTHPSDLDEAELADLEERGVRTFEAATVDGDVTTVRRYHASLLLTRDGNEVVLDFSDERAHEHAEFRVAFALWRLAGGRAPHVAFASDVPRLSPAEAYEYQEKGLFDPKGTDVYSLARATLAASGLRVTHVNPRDPVLPEDTDLLIWMQPRRSIEAMLEATVRYLHGGGRVLLAAQHFNIQSLQYPGSESELDYWPRPQVPDLDHLYFPELGIELVREVLFDELATSIETETNITGRRAGRVYDRQTSALPFLVRAVAANFADAPATRNLGDQAFPWPSYLRWDEDRLHELGITARPLITTSARTWTFAWEGGWVPPELLEGPPVDETTGAPELLGELPLVAAFEGTFPRPEGPLAMPFSGAPAEDAETEDEEPWPEPAPGELLFFACSELFKDHRLFDPEFRGDHLLWNAAMTLALEPELARIAVRRRVTPGFDYVPPEEKVAWRAAVVAAGPVALVLAAAVAALLRRRPSPAPRREVAP